MHQALNERQQAVLDWVGQGCPAGVWPDSTYKTSGQALQNRGLVKITKRRGHWSAQLTDKGRRHLTERGIHPVEQSTEPPERPRRKPALPRPRTAPRARTNYADQLLEELAANDGHLIKPIESGPHAVNWTSRVNAARKSGKIPRTQELHGYPTHSGYEIKLVDIPAWRLAELAPLYVPSRLTKSHAVVAALQKQSQPMGLTKPVQGRALRIIQTLITATEAQGHKAALGATQGAPPPHRRRKAPPHFTITAQGESVGFLVLQEQDRSEHVPTDKELADAKKYSWMRIARFDYTPPAACVSCSAAAVRTAPANGPTSPAGRWKTNLPRSHKRSAFVAKPRNVNALQTSKPEKHSRGAGKPPCRKPAPHTPTPMASNTSKSRQMPGTGPAACPNTSQQYATTPHHCHPGRSGPRLRRGSRSRTRTSNTSPSPPRHRSCPRHRSPAETTSSPSSATGALTAPALTEPWLRPRPTESHEESANPEPPQPRLPAAT